MSSVFDDLVGQEHIIDILKGAAAASRTDSVKNEAEPREQWGGALHGSRNNWRGSHMDMF